MATDSDIQRMEEEVLGNIQQLFKELEGGFLRNFSQHGTPRNIRRTSFKNESRRIADYEDPAEEQSPVTCSEMLLSFCFFNFNVY